jgi:hypothetical protein
MFKKLVARFPEVEGGFPLAYENSVGVMPHQTYAPEAYAKWKKEADEQKELNKEDFEGATRKMIKGAIAKLKKDNLIVSFLKHYRQKLEGMMASSEDYGVETGGVDDEGYEITSTEDEYRHLQTYMSRYLDDMEHWESLPIPEIKELLRKADPNEDFNELRSKLRGLEKQWAEKQREWIDITEELKTHDIITIMKFSDNMRWFSLRKAYCSKEADAMGHCGNKPRESSNDTILSLREVKEQKGRVLARPVLTFIQTDMGDLTEMKGRGNSKPSPKYHSYIVALLKHKDGKWHTIRNVRGGGYREENNFSLLDLNLLEFVNLQKTRPDMVNSDTCLTYANLYINKHIDQLTPKEEKDLEYLYQVAQKDPHQKGRVGYAKKSVGNLYVSHNKKLPQFLKNFIFEDSTNIYDILMYCTNEGKEPPQEILSRVAKDETMKEEVWRMIMRNSSHWPRNPITSHIMNTIRPKRFKINPKNNG